MLNFRFPAQEDLHLAGKLESPPTPQPNNNNDVSDMNSIGGKLIATEQERGTIFDLLVNNPMLGSRASSIQTTSLEENRRRQEKFKEHLINATKPNSATYDAFHKHATEPCSSSIVAEFTKEECEKVRTPSSDHERRPKSVTNNNGVESASVAASVQAALSALQAGQLSLNQVNAPLPYKLSKFRYVVVV